MCCSLPSRMDRRSITSKSMPNLAPKIVDLAADFRLRDAALYEKWYGEKHAAPEWLSKFVYGLPELHRAEIASGKLCQRSGLQCHGEQPGSAAAGQSGFDRLICASHH